MAELHSQCYVKAALDGEVTVRPPAVVLENLRNFKKQMLIIKQSFKVLINQNVNLPERMLAYER